MLNKILFSNWCFFITENKYLSLNKTEFESLGKQRVPRFYLRKFTSCINRKKKTTRLCKQSASRQSLIATRSPLGSVLTGDTQVKRFKVLLGVDSGGAKVEGGGGRGGWRYRGSNFDLQMYFYYTNRGANIYLAPGRQYPLFRHWVQKSKGNLIE